MLTWRNYEFIPNKCIIATDVAFLSIMRVELTRQACPVVYIDVSVNIADDNNSSSISLLLHTEHGRLKILRVKSADPSMTNKQRSTHQVEKECKKIECLLGATTRRQHRNLRGDKGFGVNGLCEVLCACMHGRAFGLLVRLNIMINKVFDLHFNLSLYSHMYIYVGAYHTHRTWLSSAE